MIYDPALSYSTSSTFTSTFRSSNLGGSRFVMLLNMLSKVKEGLLLYENTRLLDEVNYTSAAAPVNAVIFKIALVP